MNRNITALILIALAVGIYFTFTKAKVTELQAIRDVNTEYDQAIKDSAHLVELRDQKQKSFDEISDADKDRLNKIVPENIDNVRLIIDVKDDIAAKYGLTLKNIKTVDPTKSLPGTPDNGEKYGTVTLSFNVSTSYQTFLDFLNDLESSLRILDISKLTLVPNPNGNYDFSVELKTYWLKSK